MKQAIEKFVVYPWNFLFNHEVSPLRHIPDVGVRHYILQILGFMCALWLAEAICSYTFMAVRVICHTILIAAVAITVASWTAASVKPKLFIRKKNDKK
jgi:hypothetical protein